MMTNFPTKNRAVATKRILLAMDWYTHLIHRGVLDYAAEHGWSVDASMERTMNLWYGDQRVDGIICLSGGTQTIIDFAKNATVPVAFVGSRKGLGDLPGAGADMRANGAVAADYFIKQGYKRLAYATSKREHHPRIQGFVERAAEVGLEVSALEWEGYGADLSPRQKLADALAALPKPIGVMAQNDDHALVVLDACEIAGIYVPEEVAVVGGDNDPEVCDFAPIPLSSVDSRLQHSGYRAAHILDILMQGGQPSPRVEWITPAGVFVRKSSGITPVEHLGVAIALRYISDNYSDSRITVARVSEAADMSIRGLNKAMQQHLNRSISQELLRVRLLNARRMLRHTDQRVHTIASDCGFTSDKHLRETFHRHFNTSPTKWRNT